MIPAPKLLPLLHAALLALPLLLLPGCLKSSSPAAVAAVPDLISLHGTVTGPTGTSAQGIEVYVEDAPAAAAITDSSGAFELTLDHAALLTISAALLPGAGAYHLYFERPKDSTVRGLSAAIGTAERGDRNLGAVTLAPTATITGQVLAVAEGRQAAPAVATVVKLGRYQVTTGADGAFKLTGVPAGPLVISATAAGFASALQDVAPAPGQTLALPLPLVLFPEAGVFGIVQMQTPVPILDLIKAGHPFQRTFLPVGSRDARYVRYGTDAKLEAQPWHALPATFDVDFPKDGGSVLYFQFADVKQTGLSQPGQLGVVLDEFAGGAGLVINDGSGRAASRDVTLHIDVPAAAYRMRVGESLAEITDVKDAPPLAWRATAPVLNWTFALGARDNNGNIPQQLGERTLYLIFQDAAGGLSPVYTASVIVDLFPPVATPVFVIDNGAPQTTDRLVRLDIQVPANAAQMQLFEAGTSSNSIFGGSSSGTENLWMPVQPVIFYTFQKSGIHTLYLQFRTADQVLSPNYAQTILVQPFPPAPVGFAINGGAPTSVSPNLDIALVPPPMAQQFRVYESTSASSSGGLSSLFGGSSSGGSSNAPLLALVPHLNYSVTTPGVHTLYVEYLDVYNNVSPAYAQTILIDPFPPPTGHFFINEGAATTWSPELSLSITPPALTRAMAFGEFALPADPGGTWVDADTAGTYLLPTIPGLIGAAAAHTVIGRFRSNDGFLSAGVQASIIYNPFPDGGQGLTINAGAATTAAATVTLALWRNEPSAFDVARHVGPNIAQMRLATTIDGLATATFQPFSYTLNYTLPAPGHQRVYVQFETLNSEISAAYFADITYTPPVATSTATGSGTGTGTASATSTSTGSATGTASGTDTGSGTATVAASTP